MTLSDTRYLVVVKRKPLKIMGFRVEYCHYRVVSEGPELMQMGMSLVLEVFCHQAKNFDKLVTN